MLDETHIADGIAVKQLLAGIVIGPEEVHGYDVGIFPVAASLWVSTSGGGTT